MEDHVNGFTTRRLAPTTAARLPALAAATIGGSLPIAPAPDVAGWANCRAPSSAPATSTDVGASFHDTPGQPVATVPYTFAQFRASSLFAGPIGYSDPSNIVKEDGYDYAFVQTFRLPQRVG